MTSLRFLLGFFIAIFNLFILLFPTEILSASKSGIVLWAMNVLPTLLPFLIGTNILIKTGMAELIGILLEPIMYPIFGVPGCGAFALISGIISGYPVGAKITQTLRNNNQLTKHQAQRLISFCNNCGPLFILGTIGTSMLGSKSAGYFIMFVHYFSALIVGLISRFFFSAERNVDKKIFFHTISQKIFHHSDKNIGNIISESVADSIWSILQIGGFIVLFSIITKILELSNFISFMWKFFSHFNFISKLGYENFSGILIGMIEMTNGAKILTMREILPVTLIILSALVSFGGFSIHMQSLSFIAKTDINAHVYIFSKFIHAIISVFIAKLALPFFNFNFENVKGDVLEFNFADKIVLSFKYFALTLIIQFILIFIAMIIKRKKLCM